MSDLIQRVAAEALSRAEELCAEWFPGGRKRGAEWRASNIRDDGDGESLGINLSTGKWGDLTTGEKGGDLVSLYAARRGLGQLQAAQELGESLRVEDRAPRPVRAKKLPEEGAGLTLFPPALAPDWSSALEGWDGHWVYRHADGARCCVVARRVRDGKKTYSTLCWHESQGWTWKRAGLKGFPLYRLPDLDRSRPVIVCEGEKSADAAAILLGDRASVVCSIGGSGAARLSDWMSLRGLAVYVWPDLDAAGDRYASDVAAHVPTLVVLDRAWVTARRPDPSAALDEGWDAADLVAELRAAGQDPAEVALPDLPPRFEFAPDPAQTTGTAPAGRGEALPPLHVEVCLGEALTELDVRADAVTGWLKGATDEHASLTLDAADLGSRVWWRQHQMRLATEKEERYFRTAATHVVRAARELRRSALMARMLGSPATQSGRDAAARLLVAMVPGADRVDQVVFLHWLWQCKRRAAGLGADRELMPVFVGKQETGKTTTLQRLCGVWCELSIPVNATTLTDDREKFILGKIVVGIWDEMAGAAKADQAKLKNLITAERLSARALFSNDVCAIAKTCSFVGSANQPVCELIQDGTGMRRFYEYRVDAVCDFPVINATDMRVVWSAVSEADPDPLAGEDLREARRRQDELRPYDPVRQWIEHENETAWQSFEMLFAGAVTPERFPQLLPQSGVTIATLHVRYLRYLNRTGHGKAGVAQLSQRLSQEGWRQERIGPKDNRGPRLWFPPASLPPVTPRTIALDGSDSIDGGLPLG